MTSEETFQVRFWGVRGAMATPRMENLGYGGNTSCVEIDMGAEGLVILDAGTGIHSLGRSLSARANRTPRPIHIVLSHFHWDHIEGIPFFSPLYDPEQNITFHGLGNHGGLKMNLEGLMRKPYFPIDLESAAARKEFAEIDGSTVRIGSLSIQSFPLNHPQGANGFRIESRNRVLVYATDFEHGDKTMDDILLKFAQGATALICDAQYTLPEYQNHRGWGHTTWLHATEVAAAAGVGQLYLFHHDPTRSDADLDAIVAEARQHFENTEGGREGVTLLE